MLTQDAGHPPKGLRPITIGLRTAEQLAFAYDGLPDKATKSELLAIMQDVPASLVGVTQPAWDYLRYLVQRQPKAGFLQRKEVKDARENWMLDLISTFSDDLIASQLNRSHRTLAQWRKSLADAGLIAFRDSATRAKCYTRTDGQIVDAYGIDLRPLLARFDTLKALRKNERERQALFVERKKELSLARNRIRQLLPLVQCAEAFADGTAMLAKIERVRRRIDQEALRDCLNDAIPLISTLEGAVDKFVEKSVEDSANADFSAQIDSGTPEIFGAQIHSTTDQLSLKKEENSVGDGKGHASVADATSPALNVYEDENGITVQYSEAGDDDLANEGQLLAEYTSKQPRIAPLPFPTHYNPIVTPRMELAVAGLANVILPKLGTELVRMVDCPTDESLLIAYGKASAVRLGLKSGEIAMASNQFGAAFACAALISEFRPSVIKRAAHLRAIVVKMLNGDETVDLARSWNGMIRELHGFARLEYESFASRRVN